MSPWSKGNELFEGPGCVSLTLGTTTVSLRAAVAAAPSHARQARVMHQRRNIDLMALPPSSRSNERTAFGGPSAGLFTGMWAQPHHTRPRPVKKSFALGGQEHEPASPLDPQHHS